MEPSLNPTFLLQHGLHEFILLFFPVTERLLRLLLIAEYYGGGTQQRGVDHLCRSWSMLFTIWLRCSMMVTSSAISCWSRLLSSAVQSFSGGRHFFLVEYGCVAVAVIGFVTRVERLMLVRAADTGSDYVFLARRGRTHTWQGSYTF